MKQSVNHSTMMLLRVDVSIFVLFKLSNKTIVKVFVYGFLITDNLVRFESDMS
jgi:hypothetical protein